MDPVNNIQASSLQPMDKVSTEQRSSRTQAQTPVPEKREDTIEISREFVRVTIRSQDAQIADHKEVLETIAAMLDKRSVDTVTPQAMTILNSNVQFGNNNSIDLTNLNTQLESVGVLRNEIEDLATILTNRVPSESVTKTTSWIEKVVSRLTEIGTTVTGDVLSAMIRNHYGLP